MLSCDSAQFGVWPISRSEERPFSQDAAIISDLRHFTFRKLSFCNKDAFCMSLGRQTLQTSEQSSQRRSICAEGHPSPPARIEAAEPRGPAECPGTQRLTAAGLCQVPTGPAEHACVNNRLHNPGCAHRASNYYMQTKIICIYTPQGTPEKFLHMFLKPLVSH